MPIDVDRALAARPAPRTTTWSADDVILYHLGLGAGAPATADAELAYTLEDRLAVLPSFAVVPAFGLLADLVTHTDGLDLDPAAVLHGEHDLEVLAPLPPAGRVTTVARVTEVHDKGSGALVVFELRSRAEDGAILFVNRFSCFVQGEGGVGARGLPAASPPPVPSRAPDLVLSRPTLPQQALLYRLSGDRNPLHADPAFAARAGFDAPILHGLCTYGIAAKAAVDGALGGDVARVARIRARFAGVAFPGETLVVSVWREPGRLALAVRAAQRDAPVLTNAEITLRS